MTTSAATIKRQLYTEAMTALAGRADIIKVKTAPNAEGKMETRIYGLPIVAEMARMLSDHAYAALTAPAKTAETP